MRRQTHIVDLINLKAIVALALRANFRQIPRCFIGSRSRHYNQRRTNRRATGFTILELLVTVGVLSVLLAIILPVTKSVRNAALKRRAQAGATALAQAAVRYKLEYGFWPGELEETTDVEYVKIRSAFTVSEEHPFVPVIISRNGNTTFEVQTISGNSKVVYLDTNEVCQAFQRLKSVSGTGAEENPLNPRGIHFVELANEADVGRVHYPDPWGRDYILVMGLNPHSTFTHKVTGNGGDAVISEVSVSNTIAFAFSLGAEGERSTNYIYSAGVRP